MLKRFVVLALILTMVLSACTPVQRSAAPQEAGGGEDAAVGARTYVLVPKNLGNPYFDAANKGAQEAAGELGLTVLYQGSSTADVTEQIQLINALIAQEVSGLAISANDADALVPTGKEAMAVGIPVVSWDAAIAPEGRNIHVNQADAEGIGRTQVQMISNIIGGKGKVAILSATSTAPNQNEWIKWMEDELSKPEYADIELVATVYGDDEDEKSYNEAMGLMKTYPDLVGIISPTSVGIAAAGRAVTDADKFSRSLSLVSALLTNCASMSRAVPFRSLHCGARLTLAIYLSIRLMPWLMRSRVSQVRHSAAANLGNTRSCMMDRVVGRTNGLQCGQH